MNPTIWIVNEAGHPYHKALDLIPDAKLAPLTTGNINPFRLDRLAKDLVKGIVRYSQPDDYLLISGTPVLNAITVVIWLSFHRHCNLLQWNAKDREYVLSAVELDHILRLIEKEFTNEA